MARRDNLKSESSSEDSSSDSGMSFDQNNIFIDSEDDEPKM